MYNNELGKYVKQLRESMGLSVIDIIKKNKGNVNFSKSYWGLIETGTLSLKHPFRPSTQKLTAISNILNCPLCILVEKLNIDIESIEESKDSDVAVTNLDINVKVKVNDDEVVFTKKVDETKKRIDHIKKRAKKINKNKEDKDEENKKNKQESKAKENDKAYQLLCSRTVNYLSLQTFKSIKNDNKYWNFIYVNSIKDQFHSIGKIYIKLFNSFNLNNNIYALYGELVYNLPFENTDNQCYIATDDENYYRLLVEQCPINFGRIINLSIILFNQNETIEKFSISNYLFY